jgi:hypothetical protein
LFHIRFYCAAIQPHKAEVKMKGVIVQVGQSKSIVLFNNGRIAAIPTPAECHVGMVITVKFNNTLKILVITLAVVLLVGLGVLLGVFWVRDKAETPPLDAIIEDEGTYDWQRGGEKMREIEKNSPNDPPFPASSFRILHISRSKAGKSRTAGKTACVQSTRGEYDMKKFLVLALIALAMTGQVFAGLGGPGRGPASYGLPEAGDAGSDLTAVTISGILVVINGQLAVQDGSNTYFVKGLSRLMRSVSGLVVGAKVTLEGYASLIRDDGAAIGHYFNARKLTFNGQTYTVTY